MYRLYTQYAYIVDDKRHAGIHTHHCFMSFIEYIKLRNMQSECLCGREKKIVRATISTVHWSSFTINQSIQSTLHFANMPMQFVAFSKLTFFRNIINEILWILEVRLIIVPTVLFLRTFLCHCVCNSLFSLFN